MPLFISINDINANNNRQVVKKLDMCEVNEDAVKHAMAALTEPLDFIPKE